MFGELLDGVAPITEDPDLPVQERDRALRRPGVDVAFVECDQAGFGTQLRDIDGVLLFSADMNG